MKNSEKIHSQSKEVTNYNIKTPDGKLYQIIDSPWFDCWNSWGWKNNNKNYLYFLYQLNEINGICQKNHVCLVKL